MKKKLPGLTIDDRDLKNRIPIKVCIEHETLTNYESREARINAILQQIQQQIRKQIISAALVSEKNCRIKKSLISFVTQNEITAATRIPDYVNEIIEVKRLDDVEIRRSIFIPALMKIRVLMSDDRFLRSEVEDSKSDDTNYIYSFLLVHPFTETSGKDNAWLKLRQIAELIYAEWEQWLLNSRFLKTS